MGLNIPGYTELESCFTGHHVMELLVCLHLLWSVYNPLTSLSAKVSWMLDLSDFPQGKLHKTMTITIYTLCSYHRAYNKDLFGSCIYLYDVDWSWTIFPGHSFQRIHNSNDIAINLCSLDHFHLWSIDEALIRYIFYFKLRYLHEWIYS